MRGQGTKDNETNLFRIDEINGLAILEEELFSTFLLQTRRVSEALEETRFFVLLELLHRERNAKRQINE